jgi:hypothetical protein
MNTNRDQENRIRRIAFSLLFSIALVGTATIFFIVVPYPPSGAQKVASYFFGIPLIPGWLFVMRSFGGWRAIHEGQIALVPLISLFVNWGVIFAAWQLIRRANSRDIVRTSGLGIRG